MTRYFAAVQVTAAQAPALILAGWMPPERYLQDRYPVWLHRYCGTAAEAIAACHLPDARSFLVDKRPGGTMVWPRGDGLTAADVATLHADAAAARQGGLRETADDH